MNEFPDDVPSLEALIASGNNRAILHLAFVYESMFDYEKANHYFKLGAESGEPDAQFFYGFRLENGINTECDVFQANKYYKLSADQGNTDAALRLSMNLAEGNGIEYNESESRRYLELSKVKRKPAGPKLDPDDITSLTKHADEENNDEAMLLCGFFWEKNGDNRKANAYFKKSADHGNGNAQFIYALKLENGIDVKKDQKEAQRYLDLAVESGNLDAQDYLMHKNGRTDPAAGFKGLPNDMARLRKIAERGNTFAMLRLGLMYENQLKSKEANEWIKKSADKGNPNAQFIYGMRLEYGVTMPIDVSEGNKYYRRSAVQGNEDAQYRLGVNLLNGNGCIKNEKEANMFLKMSADLGNKDAAILYATNLKEGIGVEKNPELGDMYVKKSMSS